MFFQLDMFHSFHSDAGSTAYSRAYYGQGSGPIWLDDLGCNGREARLSECINYRIGPNNCQHSEDASVACEGTVLTSTICPRMFICSRQF